MGGKSIFHRRHWARSFSLTSKRRVFTLDPIHHRIDIPAWLGKIQKIRCVRRMLFIRQLGLKAYIDFSGAIHTRYSHAIGAMYFAGKISELVAGKQTKTDVEELLQSSKENLRVEGYLH